MLTNEQAEKRLKEFRETERIRKDRLEGIGKLPKKQRDLGFAFLELDAKGKEIRFDDWTKHHQDLSSRRSRLAALKAADRRKLFSIFFPKFVPYVERAWDDLGRYPYSSFDGGRLRVYTALPGAK